MTKELTNASVFQVMEAWAPLSLAYDWDNVGLQVGTANASVKKVMITLDVLESVVDEAIEKEVDLIIAHHPLLFKPLHQINMQTPIGRVINKLIKHQITVYASHTNLDITPGGVNDLLCEQLGLTKQKNLIDIRTEQLLKLAVYVPVTHMEAVRNALNIAGAGHIGNYSHCTFQTKGQGIFKPLEGTIPYSGEENELTFVDEVKLETIVKEKNLSTVIQAMTKTHPYEEVAYDIIPLMNEGETYGLGRIGVLKNKMTLENLTNQVKEAFDCSSMRVTGALEKEVQKVAVLGGSGEKYIHEAKKMGADVYITGDMTFHVAQHAQEIGLAVIDAGHYIEKIMKEATKQRLEKSFSNSALEIVASETNTDPFQFI